MPAVELITKSKFKNKIVNLDHSWLEVITNSIHDRIAPFEDTSQDKYLSWNQFKQKSVGKLGVGKYFLDIPDPKPNAIELILAAMTDRFPELAEKEFLARITGVSSLKTYVDFVTRHRGLGTLPRRLIRNWINFHSVEELSGQLLNQSDVSDLASMMKKSHIRGLTEPRRTFCKKIIDGSFSHPNKIKASDFARLSQSDQFVDSWGAIEFEKEIHVPLNRLYSASKHRGEFADLFNTTMSKQTGFPGKCLVVLNRVANVRLRDNAVVFSLSINQGSPTSKIMLTSGETTNFYDDSRKDWVGLVRELSQPGMFNKRVPLQNEEWDYVFFVGFSTDYYNSCRVSWSDCVGPGRMVFADLKNHSYESCEKLPTKNDLLFSLTEEPDVEVFDFNDKFFDLDGTLGL